MTETAKTLIPSGTQLPDLVRNLLEQPFARAQNLAKAKWEQVCSLLEGSGAPSLDEALSKSFEECKSIYCLILMELEAHQVVPAPELPMPAWFAPPAARKPPPESEGISGPAKDYWTAAHFLGEIAKTKPAFPRECAERLQGHALCFALESECQRIFVPTLAAFWPNRQAAIKQVAEGETFSLQKPLRVALDEMTKQHTDWLGDAKFPHTVVSLALRYVFARVGHQDFVPAPSEAATLMLFFGNPGPLGGWQGKNRLGVSGLTAEQTIELCFRLFHAQRLRKRLLTIDRPVDSELLEIVRHNCQRVLELTRQLSLVNHAAGEAA